MGAVLEFLLLNLSYIVIWANIWAGIFPLDSCFVVLLFLLTWNRYSLTATLLGKVFTYLLEIIAFTASFVLILKLIFMWLSKTSDKWLILSSKAGGIQFESLNQLCRITWRNEIRHSGTGSNSRINKSRHSDQRKCK